MPVKNSEKYIAEAINSILMQTYKNYELIIFDTSTDETPKIIKKITDKRIKYFRDNNKSLASVLNEAISISNGDYIARMDHDDICDYTRIEEQYNFINNNKNIDIVGTNYIAIDEDGNKLFYKKLPEHNEDIEYMMPIITSVLHPTILVRKRVLFESGLYSEDINFPEDTELFLRMLLKGYKFYNIQKPLYYYRLRNRDAEFYKKRDNMTYKLGTDYLKKYYSEKNDNKYEFERCFRIGLLEYYKGSLINSRRIFLKCIKIKPFKFPKLFRYLILSISGKLFLGNLRKLKITKKINFLINKITKIDTNKIKRI